MLNAAGAMQVLWLLAAAVALIHPAPATAKDCQHDDKNFRCVKFRGNHDGDTIRVDIAGVHPLVGENMRVRIRGIDTAEIKPRHNCRGKPAALCNARKECERRIARLARDELKQKLQEAKRIDLVNVERGNYFRLLADVHLDGKSVEPWLLKSGLAVKYRKKQRGRINWCRQVEKFAMFRQKAAAKKPQVQ